MASEISAQLAELVAQWKTLSGKEAKSFLDEEVFPVVLRKVVPEERLQHGLEGNPAPYPVMILTVGTSPEPLVISLLTWRPQKVLLLVTKESRTWVPWIQRHTAEEIQWEYVDTAEVDNADPTRLYQEIMNAYERWYRPVRGAIDITGGTKAMSAAAAQASIILGYDVLYVEAEYLPDRRVPEPGTEHTVLLPNPLLVMGEIELGQALALADRHEYKGASDILNGLSGRVPGAVSLYYEVLARICRAYHAWDALDLEPAEREIVHIRQMLHQHGREGGVRQLAELACSDALLTNQEKALKVLRGKLPTKPVALPPEFLTGKSFLTALLGTMYHMALRREAAGRLDMASLLWYRLLEMMEQSRLASLGMDTSRPDYDSLAIRTDMSCEKILDNFQKLTKQLNHSETDLPGPVSLVSGFILLEAVGHPLCQDLNKLNGLVRTRNYSIYAHGYSFTSDKTYLAFKQLTEEVLEGFLAERPIKVTGYEI